MIYIKYTYSILKFMLSMIISNYFIRTQVKYLYNTFTLKKYHVSTTKTFD